MTILDARESAPAEGGPSFSLENRLIRAAWIGVWLVGAAWTPRQFAPWRRFLLRCFGARMAPGSDVRASARVWFPAHLEMGRGVQPAHTSQTTSQAARSSRFSSEKLGPPCAGADSRASRIVTERCK